VSARLRDSFSIRLKAEDAHEALERATRAENQAAAMHLASAVEGATPSRIVIMLLRLIGRLVLANDPLLEEG